MHSDTLIMRFIRSLLYCALILAALTAATAATATENSSRNNNKRFVSCEGLNSCPFDDLTAEEIDTVISIIRASSLFPPDVLFPVIKTQEPKKADWNAGLAFNHRLAYAGVFNKRTNILSEVLIDLNAQRITEIIDLQDGISPPMMQDEYREATEIIRANLEFEAAIRRRGFEPNEVVLDIWAPGPLDNSTEAGPQKRILRAICNYNDPKSRFWYWAIIEGLIINVDLVSKQVTEIWDVPEIANVTSGIEELPDFSTKPTLKPLIISQPEGSSIQIQGRQQIQWYKWKFQYTVDPIHGLQLYHVRYQADCEERSIFYKISMSEMFVPYGAKGKAWRWRSAFDAGEYGIGKNANSLKIGVDVPENSILFNCTLADDYGRIGSHNIVEGCVAAYEKDLGILYKHTDLSTNDSDGKRGRVLVLSFMTTIANYDYTFDYIFNMDGTLEIRNKLTGIILIKGTTEPTNDENCLAEDCSSFLNDYLIGPPHQHFFNYRIDLDVDGINNYATEIDLTADPIEPGNPDNPDGGVFSAKKRLITTEGFADYNFATHRSWHVISNNSRNNYGSLRGYAIKPETFSFTYLTDENAFLAHAQFVKHPIWFTTYKDNEQVSTDRYPRTGIPNEGLPEFIKEPESLLNSDIVLWHTYGVTHSTRPEEWPIMNIHTGGFSLIPYNFISQNSEMPLKDRCP